MNILYDFSSALLQARQRKGVTQEQIAFALDISQATYNAWECGHRICPYKHIIALINYFDDEQFTRQMLRILLSLQHNMAGLNKKSTAELTTYYMKLLALLADECAEWLKTIGKKMLIDIIMSKPRPAEMQAGDSCIYIEWQLCHEVLDIAG